MDIDLNTLLVKAGIFFLALFAVWMLIKGVKLLFKVLGFIAIIILIIWFVPGLKDLFFSIFK